MCLIETHGPYGGTATHLRYILPGRYLLVVHMYVQLVTLLKGMRRARSLIYEHQVDICLVKHGGFMCCTSCASWNFIVVCLYRRSRCLSIKRQFTVKFETFF